MSEFARRIKMLFRREQFDRELTEEMRLHCELRERDAQDAGASPDDAHFTARRQFGNEFLLHDASRDAWGFLWLTQLLQDVRYALRSVAKNPRFTAVVVITLALGIGVNTAVFTIFNVTLRPLPVADPDTLVRLEYLPVDSPSNRGLQFSFLEYLHLRRHAESFSAVIAGATDRFLIGAGPAVDGPEEVTGEFVSENFFSVLGGRVLLGRTFSPEENRTPGREPVIVLNHSFWQRRFGGDPAVVGRPLLVDGKSFVVIGVMDRGFTGLHREMPAFWLPVMMRADMPSVSGTAFDAASAFANPGFRWLNLTARLKPGLTVEDARTEAGVLIGQFVNAWPERNARDRLVVSPASWRRGPELAFAVLIVLTATGLVLLIACSNLANLMLARAAARQKEIGVRLSLGATRGRLVRQFLTESLLLATLGGLAGLLLSWWGVTFLSAKLLSRYQIADPATLALQLNPDVRILAFTLALCVFSAVAFGLLPALRATRADVISTIKDEGAAFGHRLARSRFRSSLVLAQVALCLVLLVPALGMLLGLTRTLAADPGFETKRLLTLNYSLELSSYSDSRARQFQQDLIARLESLPGVQSVLVGNPPSSGYAGATLILPGTNVAPERKILRTRYVEVAPGFFSLSGISLLRGRAFTQQEALSSAPVAVVSETAARNLWPGEDPLGKLLRLEPTRPGSAAFPPLSVIGVARDAQNEQPGRIPPYFLYVPYVQTDWQDVGLLLRTTRDAGSLKPSVVSAARALEPTLRTWVRTVDEDIADSESVMIARAGSDLAFTLGSLALLLTVVGLYGVMSFSVARRTREIGIRMALGASRFAVLRLVLTQGLRLTAVGVVLGLAAGAALARVLSGLLFGLDRLDVLAGLGMALFVIVVSLVAAFFPARRAASVDPMVALRYE